MIPPSPRFAVLVDGFPEIVVTVTAATLVAWDLERERRGWPDRDTSPNLWMSWTAWKAATKQKIIDGMPWEAFSENVIGMQFLPTVDEQVDPTNPVTPAG